MTQRHSLDLLQTLVKEDEIRSPSIERDGGNSDSEAGDSMQREEKENPQYDHHFYDSDDKSSSSSSESSDALERSENSINEDLSDKKNSEKSEDDHTKSDKNGIEDSDSFSDNNLDNKKDHQYRRKKTKVLKKKKGPNQLKSPAKNVPKFPGDRGVKKMPEESKRNSFGTNRRGSLSSESDDEKAPKNNDMTGKLKNNKKRFNSTKRKKLLSRSEMAKPKTYPNADVCLEDNLYQKYKELDTILAGHFVEKTTNLTGFHIHQMEQLRQQYSSVTHGMSPRGMIIPRSLPPRFRTNEKIQLVDDEGESFGNLTDRSEDKAFQTICSIMSANNAKKQRKIRTDIRANANSDRLEKKKKANSKLNDTVSSDTVKSGYKSRKAPKIAPLDSHLKTNTDSRIKQWLNRKNNLYRQEKLKQRKKLKEEQKEIMMKAEEKAKREEESKKLVNKWMNEKKKELHRTKIPRDESRNKERKELKVNVVRPGMDFVNLPSEQGVTPGGEKETAAEVTSPPKIESPTEIRERWKQQSKERQARKQSESEKPSKSEVSQQTTKTPVSQQPVPQPPKGKFIYKRPVAGKIKLRMQKRERSTSPGKKEKIEEKTEKEMRRSYDDWLLQKRKEEQEKKQKSLQKKQMRHSDPDLSKIIPEMAQKRIEKKAADKKHVDTGINQQTKGDNSKEDTDEESVEHSTKGDESDLKSKSTYKLPIDVSKDTKSLTSPQPKPSAQSPRKAVPVKPHAQNADAVMKNDYGTNPFKLPFPPELGVPKYVAEKQKLIFNSQVFDDLEVDKRPEPQGCDANHAPLCTQAPPSAETDTKAPPPDNPSHSKAPPTMGNDFSDTAQTNDLETDNGQGEMGKNPNKTNSVYDFKNVKSGKPNMGKRVSFSEATTVFEPTDFGGSDTSSPREDVHFVEDMRSEDFGQTGSPDIPSGTFLTSLETED